MSEPNKGSNRLKPFEIFKPEDFGDLHWGRNCPVAAVKRVFTDSINRRLNEMGQVLIGKNYDGRSYWAQYVREDDEVEALLIGQRPIEREVECSHKFEIGLTYTIGTKAREAAAIGLFPMEDAIKMGFNFCPKCGKDLRGES